MKGKAKSCPKCRKIYSASAELDSCPLDGTWLNEFVGFVDAKVADKYLLEEEIGKGSWGTVYLAAGDDSGSRFAVKVLSSELCRNMRHINRFRQESSLFSQMEHPGIIKIIDCGLNPRPFVVSEFVPCDSLQKLLAQKGRLSEIAVYTIFKSLAQTLSYAHSIGVVHQNLKPEKILVQNLEPEHANIKILDFGVARLLDERAITDETGEAIGSPQYMSPQQFQLTGLVRPDSDIYALGCIMFECLTGRPAFRAKNYIEWSSVHRHVWAAFKDEDKFGKLGNELARLVLLCLSKEAEDRPSADALLEQLKQMQVIAAASSSIQQTGILRKIHLYANANSVLLGAVISVGLLLIVGVTMASLVAPKSKSPKKIQERVDESKNDLITTLAAGKTLHKIQNSSLELSKLPVSTVTTFVPESPDSIILVLSAQKNTETELEPLFDAWAKHGALVAVAQSEPVFAGNKKLSALINSAVAQVTQKSGLRSATRFALVTVGLDLDQTLAAGRLSSDDKNAESAQNLAGLVVINPQISSTKPQAVKELHQRKFPVFYVIDAEMNTETRKKVESGCQTAFTFASGNQILYDSKRVSLINKPAYTDQQVLFALISGFIDAHLKRDRAKQSYLYSQKSATAVGSAAELRFR